MLLLLVNSIPVLQGYATIAENPTASNINPNAEPRMRYVKNVKCLATSRNAVRNLVTSQKIVLIDRISLFRQVQAE